MFFNSLIKPKTLGVFDNVVVKLRDLSEYFKRENTYYFHVV